MNDFEELLISLSVLGAGLLSKIREIRFEPVEEHENQLVHVVVQGDNGAVNAYDAYAVKGKSLDEFLSDEHEVKQASLLAKGRFAFPHESPQSETNILAHNISKYTRAVQWNIMADRQHTRAQSGGEVRKLAIRGHYEKLRPAFNEILKENPGISDHHIAQKLNQLGHKSVNQKEWRASNVQGLREYLEGNPHYDTRGKGR